MNNRRKLIFALGTAGSFPFAAVSQQPKKIYRIGFVTGRPRLDEPSEAFRQRLRELGYVEGKNLVIEWRFLQARADRAPEVAAEFVRLNLDCMAAAGVGPIRAAKQATTSIPIVMINVDADPVELGFVASLARPGGNVTGFTAIAHDLSAKRLELLKELVPNAKRVGMLVGDGGNPGPLTAAMAHYRGAESAARKLGMEVRLLALKSPDELEGLFDRMADWRPEVLSAFSASWFVTHRASLLDWAGRMKIPAMYSNVTFMEHGALMAYSDDVVHRHREVAGYVAKILSGVKPADSSSPRNSSWPSI